EGLWNMFMPPSAHEDDEFRGAGLSNLEYAPLAEEMGHIGWASEVFNCSAPDTGNMEVLMRYGSKEHKRKWLRPLMDGEIRSAFPSATSCSGRAGALRLPRAVSVPAASITACAPSARPRKPWRRWSSGCRRAQRLARRSSSIRSGSSASPRLAPISK